MAPELAASDRPCSMRSTHPTNEDASLDATPSGVDRGPDIDCQELTRALRRFVTRWRDLETRRASEDLVQEAVLVTWRQRDRLHEAGRAAPYARTILRRLRYRLLERGDRLRPRSLDSDPSIAEDLTQPVDDEERVMIDGEPCDRDAVLVQVELALRDLPQATRGLLEGFYRGVPTSVLATRHAIAPRQVKAHLYRGRKRLQRRVLQRLGSSNGPIASTPPDPSPKRP